LDPVRFITVYIRYDSDLLEDLPENLIHRRFNNEGPEVFKEGISSKISFRGLNKPWRRPYLFDSGKLKFSGLEGLRDLGTVILIPNVTST